MRSPSPCLEGESPNDAKKPVGERTRPIQLPDAFAGKNECGLDDVFGVVAITQQLRREQRGRPHVSTNEDGACVLIATRDACQQRGIIRLAMVVVTWHGAR